MTVFKFFSSFLKNNKLLNFLLGVSVWNIIILYFQPIILLLSGDCAAEGEARSQVRSFSKN
jgi:hypothetical protein